MWKDILIAVGSGIAYALSGFGKSKQENFDFKQFFITGTLGAIVGFGTFFLDMSIPLVFEAALNIGATAIIENVGKTIWRRWLKALFEKWGWA